MTGPRRYSALNPPRPKTQVCLRSRNSQDIGTVKSFHETTDLLGRPKFYLKFYDREPDWCLYDTEDMSACYHYKDPPKEVLGDMSEVFL